MGGPMVEGWASGTGHDTAVAPALYSILSRAGEDTTIGQRLGQC